MTDADWRVVAMDRMIPCGSDATGQQSIVFHFFRVYAGEELIAEVIGGWREPGGMLAIAKLIAAAPKLRASCKKLSRACEIFADNDREPEVEGGMHVGCRCWYCEMRPERGRVEHTPDCEITKARAAIAEAEKILAEAKP